MSALRHGLGAIRRRALLRGLGANALLWPFLDAATLGRAHAQPAKREAQAPDNLLLVTWPCGLEPGREPAGLGAGYRLAGREPTPDGNGLASKPILTNLVGKYRDRMMIVTGLRSAAADERFLHTQGPTSMWTGWSSTAASDQAVSPLPSIDQVIAQQFETREPSLHAGVLVGAHEITPRQGLSNYHFGANGPVEVKQDPSALYRTLVADILGGRLDLRPLEEERSVLDFIKGDLERLQRRIPAEDRLRLERHLDHVRGIERQLGAPSKCEAPAPPNERLSGEGSTQGANAIELTRAQANLLAVAFSCQLTKVATLQLGRSDCMYTVPYPGATSPVHAAAHAGVSGALTRYVTARYMADRLSDVLDALVSVQLSGGQTLLDRTLVVMSSEMGDPAHGLDVPVFIAGGSQKFFRYGERVALRTGSRVQRLLVTLLRYYGFPDQSFGDCVPGAPCGVLSSLLSG